MCGASIVLLCLKVNSCQIIIQSSSSKWMEKRSEYVSKLRRNSLVRITLSMLVFLQLGRVHKSHTMNIVLCLICGTEARAYLWSWSLLNNGQYLRIMATYLNAFSLGQYQTLQWRVETICSVARVLVYVSLCFSLLTRDHVIMKSAVTKSKFSYIYPNIVIRLWHRSVHELSWHYLTTTTPELWISTYTWRQKTKIIQKDCAEPLMGMSKMISRTATAVLQTTELAIQIHFHQAGGRYYCQFDDYLRVKLWSSKCVLSQRMCP